MSANIAAVCGVRTFVGSHEQMDLQTVANDTYYNWPAVSQTVSQPSDIICMKTQSDPRVLLGFTFTLLFIGLGLGIVFGVIGKGIYRRVKKPT